MSALAEILASGPFVSWMRASNSVTTPCCYSHVSIYRGVRIGSDFVAHSHVSVREYSQIGDRVNLQNGVVIGADGFGFAKMSDGSYQKITQSGRVILEDDVEVQANATIDRAAIGETRIRRGAKIDNLVQVGHGSLGRRELAALRTGRVGRQHEDWEERDPYRPSRCRGSLQQSETMLLLPPRPGIPSDVEAGRMVSGYPAIDNKRWLKCSVLFDKLPEINRSIKNFNKH